MSQIDEHEQIDKYQTKANISKYSQTKAGESSTPPPGGC